MTYFVFIIKQHFDTDFHPRYKTGAEREIRASIATEELEENIKRKIIAQYQQMGARTLSIKTIKREVL